MLARTPLSDDCMVNAKDLDSRKLQPAPIGNLNDDCYWNSSIAYIARAHRSLQKLTQRRAVESAAPDSPPQQWAASQATMAARGSRKVRRLSMRRAGCVRAEIRPLSHATLPPRARFGN
ncbi:unnamed protein product, partial [Iphiclides podalirius]